MLITSSGHCQQYIASSKPAFPTRLLEKGGEKKKEKNGLKRNIIKLASPKHNHANPYSGYQSSISVTLLPQHRLHSVFHFQCNNRHTCDWLP